MIAIAHHVEDAILATSRDWPISFMIRILICSHVAMHVIMPWVGAKMLLTDRIASQTRLCCKGVGCDVKMESEPTHYACSCAVFGTVRFHHPRTPYLSDHSVDLPLMPRSKQENQRPEHQQSTLCNRGEGFLINCINSGITYVRVLSRVDY